MPNPIPLLDPVTTATGMVKDMNYLPGGQVSYEKLVFKGVYIYIYTLNINIQISNIFEYSSHTAFSSNLFPYTTPKLC